MSAGNEGAAAHRAEATPNVARPTSSSRRRPNRCASRPTSGITKARASRLTVTVHCDAWTRAPKSCRIAGRATTTAVWSKNSRASEARLAAMARAAGG